jgi:hypothetical protein
MSTNDLLRQYWYSRHSRQVLLFLLIILIIIWPLLLLLLLLLLPSLLLASLSLIASLRLLLHVFLG